MTRVFRPFKKSDLPTADDLRREMSRVNSDGRRLNPDGVDFDKLATVLATDDRVPGWEAPRILPPLWDEVERSALDGTTKYCARSLRLVAILSCSFEGDTQFGHHAWLHLSVSHEKRIPKWNELAEAKRVLLGDREAYQVLPPKARYVNINDRVLHLFALLDDGYTALPDFTRGTGSL
jgi:hypothetical protein